jgi:hypothetical protein
MKCFNSTLRRILVELIEIALAKLFPPRLPHIPEHRLAIHGDIPEEHGKVLRVERKKYRDGIERVFAEGLN